MAKADVRAPVVYDGFRTFPPYESTVCVEQGARQSEAKDCDINRIISQFEKTGLLPQSVTEGVFADVSQIGDYRSALERVEAARLEFMKVPPALRLRFRNDPLEFVAFVMDPANRAELESLGLVEKKAEPVAPVVAGKPA